MAMSFASKLDQLISEYKAKGTPLGEMMADMEGAIDGLQDEVNAADEDADEDRS